MSHYYHAETVSTLAALTKLDGVTIGGLASMFSIPYNTAKKRLQNLQSKALVDSSRGLDGSFMYALTSKGRRICSTLTGPEPGVVTQARAHYFSGTYAPAPVHVRQGSEAFLACPSRRGDELHPHRGPISLAGA